MSVERDAIRLTNQSIYSRRAVLTHPWGVSIYVAKNRLIGQSRMQWCVECGLFGCPLDSLQCDLI